MSKKIIRYMSAALIIILMASILTSCAKKEEAAPAPVETEKVEEVKAEPKAPEKKVIGTKPDAPKLPVEVTEDMEFFRDGYEIVTIEQLADGDTTTFRLKSGTWTTRYLAIDTPETSNGVDPWGMAAKKFVNMLLLDADQIVLEKDPVLTGEMGDEDGPTDKYGRLLAHVWADGELVQYKVVEESLARVSYLYYDYKYNPVLMQLEEFVRLNDHRRIHNSQDLDPDYDYSNILYRVSLDELDPSYYGKRIAVKGIVTGNIKGNAYLANEDGTAYLYAYSKNTPFKAFAQNGNEVEVIGAYTLYNGIPEVGSFEKAPVKLSEGNPVTAFECGIEGVSEENINRLVTLMDVEVTDVQINRATVEKDGLSTTVFIEKATGLNGEDTFKVGSHYDITGNVGVYNDIPQLMLRYESDVVEL